jgi:hypothetical protein
MNLATLRNRKRTEIIAKLREAVKGIEGEVFLVGRGREGILIPFLIKIF